MAYCANRFSAASSSAAILRLLPESAAAAETQPAITSAFKVFPAQWKLDDKFAERLHSAPADLPGLGGLAVFRNQAYVAAH
jgi:hypothetical protein